MTRKLTVMLDHLESCEICQGKFAQIGLIGDLELDFEDLLDQLPEDELSPSKDEWMNQELHRNQVDFDRSMG